MGKEDNYMIAAGLINVLTAMLAIITSRFLNIQPEYIISLIASTGAATGALTIAKHNTDKKNDSSGNTIVDDINEIKDTLKLHEEAIARLMKDE